MDRGVLGLGNFWDIVGTQDMAEEKNMGFRSHIKNRWSVLCWPERDKIH